MTVSVFSVNHVLYPLLAKRIFQVWGRFSVYARLTDSTQLNAVEALCSDCLELPQRAVSLADSSRLTAPLASVETRSGFYLYSGSPVECGLCIGGYNAEICFNPYLPAEARKDLGRHWFMKFLWPFGNINPLNIASDPDCPLSNLSMEWIPQYQIDVTRLQPASASF